jgi:putative transposase
VIGLSTRKVGETLLSILGRPISAETVSQVAKTLYRHGLTGEGLDSGLLAALPIVLHGIPVQRCWAHKIRNILDKVRKADQPNVKRALHKVMHAHNQPAAPSAARQFADRFEEGLPQCGCMPARRPRRTAHLLPLQIRGATSKVRTPNAIERRFREVRRPTRPMGTFQDKTSMDRILFAVFSHENKSQSVSTPFLLTHNN